MIDTDAIRTRYEAVAPLLNERARRVWAAGEVLAAGRGGIAAVSRAIGMARRTIGRGPGGGGGRHGAPAGPRRRSLGCGRPWTSGCSPRSAAIPRRRCAG